VDEDVPRPPPKNGENDAFAFLRQVQVASRPPRTTGGPIAALPALRRAIATLPGPPCSGDLPSL
jgi:hypothetical protein